MLEINAKEARGRLSMLLKRAEEGEEIVILRRGKKVARLMAVEDQGKRLPSLKAFRNSVKIKGDHLGRVIIHEREERRY
jgi:prevent-host-death family protein